MAKAAPYCRLVLIASLASLAATSSSGRKADANHQLLQTEPARTRGIVAIPLLVPSPRYVEHFKSKLPEESNAAATVVDEGVAGKSEGEHAGEVFAVSLIATTVLLSIAFSMASSTNMQVASVTWITIDNVITIFLAILWFKAIDQILNYSERSIGTFFKVLLAYIMAALFLVAAIMVSYSLRKNKLRMAIFCSCSTEFAAFASMLGATDIMERYFSSHVSLYFLGFIIQVIVLALLVVGLSWIRKSGKYDDDKEWSDRVDHMENEFGSMSLAVTWSLFVKYFICGAYAGWQTDAHPPRHTRAERNIMFLYVLSLAPIGSGVMWAMARIRARAQYSALIHRAISFVEAFCIDCIAWGIIFWGQWELLECTWAAKPVVGRVGFALIASIVSCLVIIFFAPQMRANRVSLDIIIGGLSVLTAWSWEESFDEALDSLETHGTAPTPFCKVAAAAILTAAILPVYATSLKPMAIQRREDLMKVEGGGAYLSSSMGSA